MGELVYVNKGDLASGSYSALLEYTDGDASDLPAVDEAAPEEEQGFLPDESDSAPQGKDGSEPAPPPEPEPEPSVQVQWGSPTKRNDAKYRKATVARYAPRDSGDVMPGYWHSDWQRCMDFARKWQVPAVFVWTNGDACGHCVEMAGSITQSSFVKFQRAYKILWCYVTSSDPDGPNKPGTPSLDWAGGYVTKSGKTTYRAKRLEDYISGFPFVNFFWRKQVDGKWKVLIDECRTGDTVRGGFAKSFAQGAKNMAAYIPKMFKSIMSQYGYDPATGQYVS